MHVNVYCQCLFTKAAESIVLGKSLTHKKYNFALGQQSERKEQLLESDSVIG